MAKSPEKKEPFLLKNIFSSKVVEQTAAEIKTVYPSFKSSQFKSLVLDDNYENLELKQRMRHISHCLEKCLPTPYSKAVKVLTKTVENMLARDGERMSFEWGIFPDFVEVFGTEDPDTSLPALEIMTQLASAEFAIRPYLLKYPERTFALMHAWSKHNSAMVRRLSSEGFRPRLPWGMGVPSLKKDPSPILPVLEHLKNDPAETVRRSVANNLNDISKEHPDLALDIATRWQGISLETDWVVRHACRGLLKKGNGRALALFGYQKGVPGIEVAKLACSPSVQIGGVFTFSFIIKNDGKKAQKIRLEYVIHYLTPSGNISRKVFKIKEMEMKTGQQDSIEKRQGFANLTTRKHHPGTHRLEILVNGEVKKEIQFEVTG